MLNRLAARLWHWRGFVTESVRRDFSTRYAASTAGMAWHFVQPITQILIYVLVFSQVMQARLPGSGNDTLAYGLFICAGLLPWQLFAEVVSRATGMFVEYSAQIRKSTFPRSSLLLVVVASASLHFAIVWGLLLALTVALGRFPGLAVLALLPPLVLLLWLAAAAGLVLGLLNAYLRDVGQMVGVALQFLFWLSPIVWPLQAVPAAFHPWLLLNPLAGVLQALQGVLVHGAVPDWSALLPALGWCLGATVLALVCYRRLSPRLVDEL